MALVSDYDSLITNLQSYNERTDSDYIAQCPTFIALAEKTFSRLIRSRETSYTTTLTTDADGYVDLPTDFLRFRSFHSLNGNLSQSLDPIAQGAIAALFPIDSAMDPYYVSILGNRIRIQPSYAADVVMEYDRKFVGLGPSNSTNWVMDENPDLYLFGSMAHAAFWLKDYSEASVMKSQAQEILDDINTQYGMELYTNAGLTLTGPTP